MKEAFLPGPEEEHRCCLESRLTEPRQGPPDVCAAKWAHCPQKGTRESGGQGPRQERRVCICARGGTSRYTDTRTQPSWEGAQSSCTPVSDTRLPPAPLSHPGGGVGCLSSVSAPLCPHTRRLAQMRQWVWAR